MNINALLETLGGVARTRELRDGGVSADRIARAVSSGRLIRPRRGWVALPTADPDLIRAARNGVLLTCVTQAQRLGLWTLRASQVHVAATRSARPVTDGCVVHWGTPIVARPPGALEDSLPNVLQMVAACLPYEEALAIWNSALNKSLIDVHSLRRLGLRGSARRLLVEARPYFDSGLETLVMSRLRWLRIRLTPQAHIAGHRVDLLIGDRLVVQIDGAHHTGRQRDADIAHDALLVTLGYTVLRVSYWQVIDDWHTVQLRVMECIAQGQHVAH